MKRFILSIAVLLFFLLLITNSYSQSSIGVILAEGHGRQMAIPPGSSTCGGMIIGFSGILLGNLNNVPDVPFYCLDVCIPLSPGDSIVDSSGTYTEAIYIANNYYPSAPPVLTPDDEACAVQLAIWHFRNHVIIANVNITGGGDTAIRARADTIIAQTIANGGGAALDVTLSIHPAANPDNFFVLTTNTSGDPVAVDSIALSITGGGTLSTMFVVTDITGHSPDVIVTGANNGSVISATARVEIPAGVLYTGYNTVAQPLVLAGVTQGFRTATILWGTLPVELLSFTSFVRDREVTLNWNTSSESDNSGFDIERRISGSNEWTKTGNVSASGSGNSAHSYSFTDRNLSTGKYSYRLKQIDLNGNFEYHYLNSEIVIGVPVRFDLGQNYPNPFNPSTSINFDLPDDGHVTLKVFNVSGKEVETIVNDNRTAGYYTVKFNASGLSSGIYYYRLESNGVSRVMKMALIK